MHLSYAIFYLQDENHASNHLNNIYYYIFELHCFQKDENHKSDHLNILYYIKAYIYDLFI